MLLPPDRELIINGVGLPSGSVTEPDCYRIYDIIWRNMDRENALINYRISWAILLTAGFLTAESFLIGRIIEVLSTAEILRVGASEPAVIKKVTPISCIVCAATVLLSVIAAWFCWRTHVGVTAAISQIGDLKRFYKRCGVGRDKLFEDILHLPRPFGDYAAHRSGNSTAQAFPIVMVGIWMFLALVEIAGTILLIIKVAAGS